MSQSKITSFFIKNQHAKKTKGDTSDTLFAVKKKPTVELFDTLHLKLVKHVSLQVETAIVRRYDYERLCVVVYEDLFVRSFCDDLFQMISTYGKFNRGSTNKNGQLSRKRKKCTYGGIDNYVITYKGQKITNHVIPWQSMPILEMISTRVSELTKEEYNVCTIQYYNNGNVGIKPHRDKEMKHGTVITSLSLGATRVMRFSLTRDGKETNVDIPLPHGSLCCIYPPTNDVWLHSIPLDKTTDPRMSLIFRRY